MIKAYLWALMACVIWAGNFVIARGVYSLTTPISLAFWRWAFACLAILPFALPKLKTEWHHVKSHPILFFVMGCLGVGSFNTLVYYAAQSTEAQNIALICSAAPLWIALLSALLKHERLTVLKSCGLFLALLGALLVIARGSLGSLLDVRLVKGDLIVFVASWVWAVYSILLKRKPQGMDDDAFLFFQVLLGMLSLLPFFIWETVNVSFVPFSAQRVMIYLYLSVGASVIAFKFWIKAIALLGPLRTSLLYYTTPVFSALLAAVFLKEHVHFYHVLSLLSILLGLVLYNYRINDQS